LPTMPPMVAREAVEMSTGNHKPCGLMASEFGLARVRHYEAPDAGYTRLPVTSPAMTVNVTEQRSNARASASCCC
jgi:hypothetical protein